MFYHFFLLIDTDSLVTFFNQSNISKKPKFIGRVIKLFLLELAKSFGFPGKKPEQ